jgi:hypothetical protein
MWVYQSPPLTRLPTVYILYEILDDKGIVVLWSFSVR